MEKIKVEIRWCDKNYACVWGTTDFGSIVVTHKNLDELKSIFAAELESQINDMLASEELLPKFLAEKDYAIEYTLHISALLRQASQYTSMAVISRACGINQKQLTHYASSLKEPRKNQKERILLGLQSIGREILSLH